MHRACARGYPVEMQVRFGSERIKVLEQGRCLALREGNLRVVRRASVLPAVAACWGVCPATVYA